MDIISLFGHERISGFETLHSELQPMLASQDYQQKAEYFERLEQAIWSPLTWLSQNELQDEFVLFDFAYAMAQKMNLPF